MTRRPYEPGEIDGDGTDLDLAAGELERYAALTATATPRDLGRALTLVRENRNLLLEAWYGYFGDNR